jgi:hypothetical protein
MISILLYKLGLKNSLLMIWKIRIFLEIIVIGERELKYYLLCWHDAQSNTSDLGQSRSNVAFDY